MRLSLKSILFAAPVIAAATFSAIMLIPRISHPMTTEQLVTQALAVPTVTEGHIYSRTKKIHTHRARQQH